MTRSPSAELYGVQEPRIGWSPPAISSAGEEAIELARMAGLELDPWQELVLAGALGEQPDGRWAALSVGLVVPRQNGKGSILEARELAGLFLLGERLLTHTAHQFDTSLEAFRRLLMLIEETPDFDRRVKRVSRSHGEEGIELKGGQRIRFRTRTGGGGRGFTGDCVIFDEAMILPETALGALMPALSARPNPQLWYVGSAVDKTIHEHGIVFSRIRNRGHAQDPTIAFYEFSIEVALEKAMDERIAKDPAAWARGNPALGFRITPEFIAEEYGSMDARTFAVERLGAGDWPDPTGTNFVIHPEVWAALTDLRSTAQDPVALAFDVTPDRSAAAIAAAGPRPDGRAHGEIIEHRRGTGWVASRLAELKKKHNPLGVFASGAGPAAALFPALEKLGIEVTAMNANEEAQACGQLYDASDQDTLRHLGSTELADAIKGAVKRPLGDAWAWSRKNSTIDISPLVAVTNALWGASTGSESIYETRGLVVIGHDDAPDPAEKRRYDPYQDEDDDLWDDEDD